MKIYAICVVKNEVDIIEYSLIQACQWADKVIVYDNGSNDGTWERIKKLANDQIVIFRQDERPYSDGLRAHVFNAYKSELSDGDWWVIQDGDEIYDQTPREFLLNHPGYYHHVNGKKIDFCFDLSRIDEIKFNNDFEADIQLFDHYTPEAWSEPRMIKHRHNLIWEEEGIWPTHMGLVCRETINIRHYPLRSAKQMIERWKTRKNSISKGGQKFNHWEKEDWKEYYSWKLNNLMIRDQAEDVFEIVPFANNYKQSWFKRLIKWTLHRFGILP